MNDKNEEMTPAKRKKQYKKIVNGLRQGILDKTLTCHVGGKVLNSEHLKAIGVDTNQVETARVPHGVFSMVLAVINFAADKHFPPRKDYCVFIDNIKTITSERSGKSSLLRGKATTNFYKEGNDLPKLTEEESIAANSPSIEDVKRNMTSVRSIRRNYLGRLGIFQFKKDLTNAVKDNVEASASSSSQSNLSK